MCEEHQSAKLQVQENLKQQQISLKDCLDLFQSEEQLERDNAWYCNACKIHVEATKKLELYRLPKILVIALKRFKNRNYCRDKNGAFVDFPMQDLDISQWVKGKFDNHFIYDCFAVSNHYGGLGGGHYTAFALNEQLNQWFEFNDSRVEQVGQRNVIS